MSCVGNLKIIIAANLLLVACNAFAQKKESNYTLGVAYVSKMVHQGALLYDAPIVAPVIGFTYRDRISFGLGGLQAYTRFGKFQKLSLSIPYFRDYPMGVYQPGKKDRDFKNQRRASVGAALRYNVDLSFLNMEAYYQRNININAGDYYYGKAMVAFLPILRLGFGYGFGDEKNNRYIYGKGAISGSGHRDYIASFFWPVMNGIFTLNYSHSQIIQKANQQADYIRNKSTNSVFSSTLSWSF